METIKIKMSKEQFVERLTSDLEEKKQKKQAAQTAVFEYIKDRYAKEIRRKAR